MRRLGLLLVSIALWGALPAGARALHSTASASLPGAGHLNVRRLAPRDGLPAAVVYCVSEDSLGFLWFGTADGIARYDSHEFRVFKPDPADPGSLANGGVLAIQEDEAGDLWIATEGGLERWHRDTESFSHYRHDPDDPQSLSDDTTQCLIRDPDGTLWVGTARGGLNHFDPRTGKCVRYLPRAGATDWLNDPWVRCLWRDRAGRIWIGTGDGGLNRLDPGTGEFRVYRHDPAAPDSLSDDRVSAIVEDADGALWIGTDRGVCRLDADRERIERLKVDRDDAAALPTDAVAALAISGDGRLWVGTDGGGVSIYDPGSRRFVHHRHSKFDPNTLMSNAVRTIFEDARGDLWIGHIPAGVSHVDRLAAPFQPFRSVPGETNTPSDDHVLAFFEDQSGDLWVGTDSGGLNHLAAATGRWTAYRHDPRDPRSLGGKAALTVLRDHRGAIWVGAWAGGLNRLDPVSGTFHRYMPDRDQAGSLTDPDVWQLAEDAEGGLWIATIGGGVLRRRGDGDTFEAFRHDPSNPRSLNDDIVSALVVVRDGALWVGTPRGLARWAPATRDWDRFPDSASEPGALCRHRILDILQDHTGAIWATTEGGGLVRLDPASGETDNYTMEDGLPSNVLRGLLEDDEGALWIGTNRGLVRFDPATRQVRIFDESKGLPGAQFTPHARLRLRSGAFLFGTTEGYVRFDPRGVAADTSVPPVVLTGFDVFNDPVRPGAGRSLLRQSITESRHLALPAALSVVSFQFAALSYRSPEHTAYQFKLEGFDEGWRAPGPERRATFTNLDPGHYVLRVRAANSDGVWNPAGVALDLVIVPPWWRTLWFRIVAALAVLGTTTGIGWRVSARRLRELQRQELLAQERARAVEAVCKSERELHLILNSIPAMVWYKDTQNRILGVNEAAARVEGRRAEDLIGCTCGDLYPAGLAAAVYDNDMEVVRSGRPRLGVQERHFARGSTDEFWLDVSRVPVFDARGTVTSLIVFAIDTTEDRRTQEALQATAARLKEAQRIARLGSWDLDLRRNVLSWSDEIYRIFEIDPARFGASYEAFLGLIHPDDRAGVDRAYRRSIETRAPYSIDHRLRFPDGRIKFVHEQCETLFEGDTPVRSAGTVQDITEQKRAEEALRASEIKYRTLIQNLQAGVVVHAADTRIVTWNAEARSILGLTDDQMSGRSAADPGWSFLREDGSVMPPEEYPVHQVLVTRQPIGNQVVGVHRPADGQDVWVMATANPVLDRDGRISEVIVTFIDITERRAAQARLAHLASIVEFSGDAIIGKTLGGVIISWNRGAERMYGYAAEEIVGRSVSILVPPDMTEDFAAIMEGVRLGERVERRETMRVSRDGRLIHVALTISPIKNDRGEIVGASTIARDISDRVRVGVEIRQLNQELDQRVRERTAQLEAANKELESFSYSVSHDLRTPLRSIDGFSRILLEEYRDKLDAEGIGHLDMVRSASQRMGQLIDDILRLSKVSRVDMYIAEIALSELAGLIVDQLRRAEPRRPVEVEIEPGLTCRGDIRLLRVALENLFGNAWKFTSRTPEARIQFGVTRAQDGPVFHVRDNGVGFDPRYASKLFSVFQRLHSANEFPGTGIGLATVQRIIHRHGGRVWAESTPGQGATFSFTLAD